MLNKFTHIMGVNILRICQTTPAVCVTKHSLSTQSLRWATIDLFQLTCLFMELYVLTRKPKGSVIPCHMDIL